MVTVLIPARNEEKDIECCLRAVLAQDYPHDRMEIVLVDGGSSDQTARLAATVLSNGDIDWKVVDNPIGTTPSNLNTGLEVATGDFICRVDARSLIPREYVRLCAEVLESRPQVVVTGGRQVAMARSDRAIDRGIARGLNNRYAMGGSRYRSGSSSGPTDTVYLGAFRVEQLRAEQGWNVDFPTNQDYELNRRLGRCGTVWFDDRLAVGYRPRSSLRALWRQYRRFGSWKVRYWRGTGDPPRARQLAPFIGLVLLLLGVAWRPGLRRNPGVSSFGLLGASVCSLALLDSHGGPSDADVSLLVRVVSILTICTVVVGWMTGVLVEAITGAGEPES